MNRKIIMLLSLLLGLVRFVSAQEVVYTESGRRVILYADHTWEYLRDEFDRVPEYDRWTQRGIERLRWDRSYYDIRTKDRNAGKNVDLIVDGLLRFELKEGKLSKWEVIGDPSTVRYDRHSGKVSQAGAFDVKYSFFDDKLERVGDYEIKYDFGTDRVKKIGKYDIEYNFFNDKIKKIGSTYINYGPFNDLITEISGRSPGLLIFLY